MAEKEYITCGEAGELVGVTKERIRQLCSQGRLKFHKQVIPDSRGRDSEQILMRRNDVLAMYEEKKKEGEKKTEKLKLIRLCRASRQTRIPAGTLSTWLKQGVITGEKIGYDVYVSVPSIKEYVEKNGYTRRNTRRRRGRWSKKSTQPQTFEGMIEEKMRNQLKRVAARVVAEFFDSLNGKE